MASGLDLSEAIRFNSDLMEELSVLREIYMDEMDVQHSKGLCSVKLQIHPSVGEHCDKKLVSVILVITPCDKYPDVLPQLTLLCPRGLSESFVNGLEVSLMQVANKHLGSQMMYTLAEYLRECLTNNNVPSIECMICLNDFLTNDLDIVKTSCCHYFHAGCLHRYIKHVESDQEEAQQSKKYVEVLCPICRLPISTDLSRYHVISANFEDDPGFTYVPSKEILQMQDNMRVLFLKQKAQGGIIDLEEEKKKYLITMH